MRALFTTYRPILGFLGKMLLAYVVWYVVYHLWLFPDGRLDALVARNVALLSGGALHLLGVEASVDGRVVLMASGRGIFVADECTGLAAIGLFLGFVLAFPGSQLRRMLFIPMGMVAIHLANVVRIAFLAWFNEGCPAFFDAVHEWGVLPFYYAVVFVLWMVWAHYGAGRGIPHRAVPHPAAG